MSTTIDENVVEMKFDNNAFLRGIRSTLDALGTLTSALKLGPAAKGVGTVFTNLKNSIKLDDSAKNVEKSSGRIITAFQSVKRGLNIGNAGKSLDQIPTSLDNITRAGRKVSITPLTTAISDVAKNFSIMQVAGVTAIASISLKLFESAKQFAKGFTTAPIKQGLNEYETNLNAIQTVLANTGLEGQKGLNKVNAALQELNDYSDKTIYNFSQMARNVGTFTAAGVKLDVATGAIKGIANLAALSGSNADQASTAMYQLSQALSSGTVKLMDWNSVVNAGMGGKVFQEALKETARAHGVGVDAIIKKEGSFRDSLQTGWLSSGILTETLKKFTGDLTASQLKTMGYTDKQITGILKMGKTAQDAATKVKTFTQLVGTLKESAASGWAKTWQLMLGDFGQAKTMFTNINNVLGGFIQRSADARNKVLGDWNKLGGRTILIKGIGDAFKALTRILKPIKDAFREIFPAKTGKDLLSITKSFAYFTKSLIIGKDTANLLKRTFKGVFAIFDIVGKVISGAIGFITDLFFTFSKGKGAILDTTASWGDWLVKFNKMLEKSGAIKKFFDDLLDRIKDFISELQPAIKFVQDFAGKIANLFGKFDKDNAAKVTDAIDKVQGSLTPLKKLANNVRNAFKLLGDVFSKAGKFIGNTLRNIGEVISNTFEGLDFGHVLDVISVGLLGGIILMLKNFFSKGIGVDLSGGLIGSIKEALGSVTESLKVMQLEVKADAIFKIATSLAILAGSILILSMIDSKKLGVALGALITGLLGISGVMIGLSKLITISGSAKLPLIATAMLIMSVAMLALAGAIKIMSTIEPEDMSRSIISLGGALLIIAFAMKRMPRNMVLQAVAIQILAGALVVLAGALKLFATISWGEMAHGLSALGGALVVLASGMRLMPKNMVLQAVALGILAGALIVLAGAVKLFATISWDDLVHGLAGIGGALAVIALAMRLMPKNMLLQSAALVAVSVALTIISAAVIAMSLMGWEAIAKGLIALGGALFILAVALNAMNGTLTGAAAMTIAAAALAILTPVLITLGTIPWTVLVQGLLALAGIFTVMGIAGYLLAPVVPVIIGLAAAIVLIGAGMALAGIGMGAFAVGFAAIVTAASIGIGILADIISTFVLALPGAMEAFGRGLGLMAGAITESGPKFVGAFSTILSSILQAVIVNAPKIAEAVLAMLNSFLRVIVNASPNIARAGLKLIVDFLGAVEQNIDKIVTIASSIIVKFLGGISKNLRQIIDSGIKLVISFINGVAEGIRENDDALIAAGLNLADAIIDGMANGIRAGASRVKEAVRELANSAFDVAKDVLGIGSPSKEFAKLGKYINLGLAKGLKGNTRASVLEAFRTTSDLLKDALRASVSNVKDAQDKLKKLKESSSRNPKAIAAAKKNLAESKNEQTRSQAAYKTLMKNLADEKTKLLKLAKSYEVVTAKLNAAKQVLADAKKVRDDYSKSIGEQYSILPEINDTTKLSDFREDMQRQIIETQKFAVVMAKLRTLGLNDTLYEELLSKGIGALPFADELLSGGAVAVTEMNDLSSTLAKEATALGSVASKELYQAGVDVAAGLVKGLKDQQAAINKEMDKIADYMVAAIKKKLGIKSPSREFAKIAGWSVQGLAAGLKDSSHISEKAAEQVGLNTLDSMRKSIRNMSVVTDGMDMRPTISPILDLTDVKNKAKKLADLIPSQTIKIDTAYSSARNASFGYDQNRLAEFELRGTTEINQFKFIQNNTSPKALSPAEIYRQTRNQLSIAKGALPNA